MALHKQAEAIPVEEDVATEDLAQTAVEVTG